MSQIPRIKVTQADYEENLAEGTGWCSICEDFTTYGAYTGKPCAHCLGGSFWGDPEGSCAMPADALADGAFVIE